MNISIIIANFNDETMILQPWSYAYKIANYLTSLGCHVTLFTNRQSNISSIKDSVAEMPLQILPSYNLRFLNKKSLEVVKRKKPDVIYWFGNSLSGVYLRKMKKLNLPIVLHISAPYYSLSDLKSLSIRDFISHWLHVLTALPPGSLFVRFLNDDTIAAITVPSKASKNRLVELGVDGGKIKAIPLTFIYKGFVDSSIKTIESARRDLGLKDDTFIVTYFGSPKTVRGTDSLIKATNKLKSKITNFRVIILSRRDPSVQSQEEELLFKLVRRYSLDDVVEIITGRLQKERVKDYLMSSNLIVLPFNIIQSEPPISVFEAMALGKVVITTRTGGLPEIIDSDRGVLIKPGDANDLARAIYCLAQKPEKVAELGRRAKDFVLNLPDWEELGRWTLETLRQATVGISENKFG